MPKPKYYVVWKGRKTGIFDTWEECQAQVSGFPGAEYKSFETLAAARQAFKASYQDHKGKNSPAQYLLDNRWIAPPVAESYCVDAASSGNPGLLEYQCVHTTTRKRLFYQGPFQNGTNNIGEFLAIVHALALFKKRGWTCPLYTDSETAISWVKAKKCKTRLPQDESNRRLFELIAQAEEWLAHNDYTTPLLKWDTVAWGEIPADFGRK